MSWFQLDPESVANRVRARGQKLEIPALGLSIRRGILGFTLLSVAGFAPWAVLGRVLYRHAGEAGLYAICAIVFIGLSGLLLHRLILGPGSLARFYKLFSLIFSAYAVLWICVWMGLRGHSGSLAGLLAGTAVMGWLLARAFDAEKQLFKIISALFVLNSIGYFAGGWLESAVTGLKSISLPGGVMSKPAQGMLAKLLWGVCYGVGFGAGLGLAFHLCQARTRSLLTMLPPDRDPAPTT